MSKQDNARVSEKTGEKNMQTVWSDLVAFFRNVWAEVFGFFTGLFGHGSES